MKILIAPNAFKGSLSAAEAARVIARSLPNDWDTLVCPIADGGDGTVDCLVTATDGKMHNATVTGPIPGMKVNARWGELGNQRAAIIETAEAVGLRLLTSEQRSASRSTTYGVGELILDVLEAGIRTIYIGLGGSATNDGGVGCAQALGVKFLDRNGVELPPGGIHLRDLHTIVISGRNNRINECKLICLADVQNTLTGPFGTTRVYGAQKGATPDELELLEKALQHYAAVVQQQLGIEVAQLPGGGAAGGLGAGLHAFCIASIVSGIDYVLDLVGFDELLRECDLVVTGEGSIDEQTLQGKGIAGIARRARRFNKPVYAFAGRVRGDVDLLRKRLDVQSIHQIAPPSMGNAEAINRARELLEWKVKEIATSLI